MHKIIITSIASLLVAMPAWALQVDNTAGGLQNQVTDTTVTQLTITGTLDARDFSFISAKLPLLEKVDLSGATIVAYQNEVPVFGTQTIYGASQLPSTSFFGKVNLSQVILPQGLTAVGYAAFAGCSSLSQISLPESVDSIGDYAFSSTSLTSLTLPQGIKVVGEGAYSRCYSLTSVSVPTGKIGPRSFLADAALTSATLGTVSNLGERAFAGCSSLKSLTLSSPISLKTIGAEAFVKSGITTLDFGELTRLTSIGDWAFAGTGITKAVLPNNVERVGQGAFFYAEGINEFAMPQAANELPAFVLAGTSIADPTVVLTRVSSIGDYAFYNVSTPTEVSLPYNLKHIGTRAMAGMTGLTTLHAHNPQPAELGDSVWAGIDQSKVELLAASQDYKTADQWKDFKTYYSYLLGDANRDGRVDVGDVTTIVAHLLKTELPAFDPVAADVNIDGMVSINDVTKLVAMLMAGETTTIVKQAPRVNTSDAVTLPDINIKPGETAVLQINLSNASAYAAAQFDLVLPDGLELVDGSQQGTDRSSKQTWMASTLPDGTVRIMGMNMDNAAIAAGEGEVVSIVVRATQSLAAESVISANHIVLAADNGTTRYAAAAQSRVNNTTGITNATAEAQAKVYAFEGTLFIESQADGIAQLVATNGTATTLIVQAGRNSYTDLAPGFYVVRVAGKSHKVVIK